MTDFHILDWINTVSDAQEKFWSISLVDAVLIWYQGSFVYLHPKMLRRTIKDTFLWMPKLRESDIIESLCDHICSSCDHALRTPGWMHHLFRYMPFWFSEDWDRWWDTLKEVFYTVCVSDIPFPSILQKPISLDWDSDFADATLHMTPTEKCPKESFLLRKN